MKVKYWRKNKTKSSNSVILKPALIGGDFTRRHKTQETPLTLLHICLHSCHSVCTPFTRENVKPILRLLIYLRLCTEITTWSY